MSTPIGRFRTSKITYEKPEVVLTSPLIDIYTSFQILNKFYTIGSPIGVFKTSKMTSTKTGSSYNVAHNWYLYFISIPKQVFKYNQSNEIC